MDKSFYRLSIFCYNERIDNPRILLLDIESGPNVSYTWGKWEQNVLGFEKEWELLCVGYKWLGETVQVAARPNFKNEKALVTFAWKLLDKADVVIAHNGKAFDLKKLNAKFVYYDMGPPSPYRTVDTLLIARKYFAFNGNKLGDLGPHLNLGAKIDHIGFKLWLGCIKGDMNSWRTMIRYNKQDVNLLEKVYKRFLPYISNHPNLGMWIEKTVCPKCASGHLKSNGWRRTQVGKYRMFKCLDCGGHGQIRVNEQDFKVATNA